MAPKINLIGGLILCVGIVFIFGCSEKKAEVPPQKKEPVVEAEPIDVGDPNAPVMIRALQGAKEAKQKIDEHRKEDSEILKQQ